MLISVNPQMVRHLSDVSKMAFDPRYTYSKLDAGDMDSIEV